MMTEPPPLLVAMACRTAMQSPCAKSKRGVVIFDRTDWEARPDPERLGDNALPVAGYNHPPAPYFCDGSEACKLTCGKFCIHAEVAALRVLETVGYPENWDLIHVKVDDTGKLVGSGPPSCWQCSREILEVGLGGVWLYEIQGYKGPMWVRRTALEFHEITLHQELGPAAGARWKR